CESPSHGVDAENHPIRRSSVLGPTTCRICHGTVDELSIMSLLIYDCLSFEKCHG
ncbi:hypothetical protein K443DRAFT_102732, partial [Laccaria amethystina LaAM-08-1]